MSSERKFIRENIRRQLLKEHLFRETQRAGFGGLDVARTPLGTHITLIAERPGMVIGRRGATINRLTDEVENDFGFDNPQIEVQEAEVPSLNPGIMAQKLAIALEKGWHFRRAGHSTVMRIMEAGARGCQVEISGKLTGDRHRTVKFRQGHIKYCGEPKQEWMMEAITTAAKKSGVLGLKVSIMDPDARLPDEIELLPPEELTEVFEEYGEGDAPEGPYKPPEGMDEDALERMVDADAEAATVEGEATEAVEAAKEPEVGSEAGAKAAKKEEEKPPKAKKTPSKEEKEPPAEEPVKEVPKADVAEAMAPPKVAEAPKASKAPKDADASKASDEASDEQTPPGKAPVADAPVEEPTVDGPPADEPPADEKKDGEA
jgi:small subunit ribosomal protein S3